MTHANRPAVTTKGTATAAVAVPFALTAGRFAWLNRHLATASGVLSLGVGLWMAYQIGVVDGLFGAVPHWSPE